MISRIKWDALKKQSPAVTDQPQCLYVNKLFYYKPTNFKLHISTQKKGKVSKLRIIYLNFHFYFMIKSYLSQVFRPASFVFAKIFSRMTNTTPCSIGRSAPFQMFFVPSTTRFAPPLNCSHRAFINTRHYFFHSKSNLNTLRRRVYHVTGFADHEFPRKW